MKRIFAIILMAASLASCKKYEEDGLVLGYPIDRLAHEWHYRIGYLEGTELQYCDEQMTLHRSKDLDFESWCLLEQLYGSWAISADQKNLTLSLPILGDNTYKIVRLSNKYLVLERETENGLLRLEYGR